MQFKKLYYIPAIIGAIYLGIWLQHIQTIHIDQKATLSFLNVGQGDCAVFEHLGKTILIDAGPKNREYDSAAKIIVPFLYNHKINTIDLLLLSHPDLDHVGGLTTLTKKLKIGKIIMPFRFKSDKDMQQLLAKSGLKLANVYWLKEKAHFLIDKFKFELFAPPVGTIEKDNEGSMFVRIIKDKCSALFTGDASITTENQMIPYNPSWNAELLKAGHHGSKHSTGIPWLNEVNPKQVIFSCGKNNPYNHPHLSTLQRVSSKQINCLRTDQRGHIIFQATSNGFILSPNRIEGDP